MKKESPLLASPTGEEFDISSFPDGKFGIACPELVRGGQIHNKKKPQLDL